MIADKNGVHPIEKVHIDFRVNDQSALKPRLDIKGISYSDCAVAEKGRHQNFFFDPEENVSRVHDAREEHFR